MQKGDRESKALDRMEATCMRCSCSLKGIDHFKWFFNGQSFHELGQFQCLIFSFILSPPPPTAMVPLSCSQHLRLTLRDTTLDVWVFQGIWPLFNLHTYTQLQQHGFVAWAWRDALEERLSFNEHDSTETAGVPCSSPLCNSTEEVSLCSKGTEHGWGLRPWREVLLWHTPLAILTLFVEVFMYYETLSQSMQETIKDFMRCIHGWWENLKCNLGRRYLRSRRADESTYSLVIFHTRGYRSLKAILELYRKNSKFELYNF